MLLMSFAVRAQPAPQTAPVRAPSVENTVARSFEDARSRAHLRHFARIDDRTTLRQIVCTAAETGRPQEKPLVRESHADSAIFALHDASQLPPDVVRVAEYDDRHSARGRRITRYSVAAFTAPDGSGLIWVGIGLYWSRSTEFFALHFTASYDPSEIHYSIVAPCAAIR